MDPEIKEFVDTALDKSLSTYYRKGALNKLGRLKKSAELTSAILKLLKDVDDDSLQKEVMDLTVKFAISGAVDYIIPIGAGKGKNARYALTILAKLGGSYSYKYLKSLADKPGFDLTKNAASRALHDLLAREPDLEKVDTSIIEEKADLAVKPESSPQEIKIEYKEDPAVSKLIEDLKQKIADKDKVIKSLNEKYIQTERELGALRKANDQSALSKIEEENHKLRTELSKVTAAFKTKISEMDLEMSDLNDRLAMGRKLSENQAKNGGKGCLIFLFFVFMIFIMLLR